jgi:hypothetical protein
MHVLVRKVWPIIEILADGALVTVFDPIEEVAAQSGVVSRTERPAFGHLATAAGTHSRLGLLL